VSYSWANNNLKEDDEILLTTLEHHANIVPWHFLRQRKKIKLVWVDPDENGNISLSQIKEKITSRTKLVCITHMSNVFGSVLDVKLICSYLKSKGITSVVDGSQAAVHFSLNVKEIGCDFYVFTGHKVFGPTGTGILYIDENRLREMVPFNGGGDMIKIVTKEDVSYNESPHIFEAGTPSIAEIIGLGTALDFMGSLDYAAVNKYELDLSKYIRDEFKKLDWIINYGLSEKNLAIFSFALEGNAHSHDIATILDNFGIAVRSGHHCAQPLMNFLGVSATCRASFALYNTDEDADALINALKKCKKLFS
jgi:cysteine desulfurase/selenocysteine lyase